MALQSKALKPKKLLTLIIVMLISWSSIGYLVYNNFIKKEQYSNVIEPIDLSTGQLITPESQLTPPAVAEPGADVPPMPVVPAASPATPALFGAVSAFPSLPELPAIDFEKSFLYDSKFLNLTQHGELPVTPGIIGRENPFLPFAGLETEEAVGETTEGVEAVL